MAAVLNHIWGERNSRVLKHKNVDREPVISNVEEDIRNSIGSWRDVKRTDENRLISMDLRIPPKSLATELLKFSFVSWLIVCL